MPTIDYPSCDREVPDCRESAPVTWIPPCTKCSRSSEIIIGIPIVGILVVLAWCIVAIEPPDAATNGSSFEFESIHPARYALHLDLCAEHYDESGKGHFNVKPGCLELTAKIGSGRWGGVTPEIMSKQRFADFRRMDVNAKRWAEISYYLVANGIASNGKSLYQIYRRQNVDGQEDNDCILSNVLSFNVLVNTDMMGEPPLIEYESATSRDVIKSIKIQIRLWNEEFKANSLMIVESHFPDGIGNVK